MDIEQTATLIDYLRRTNRIEPDERPLIEILSGGVSNRTVFVRRPNGSAWVLKQALAKLRVQVDWFSSPERVHREALGMEWLHRLAPAGSITRLLFEDHNEHLLCMEAVPQPHANWKSLLLSGDLRIDHAKKFGALLGTIHRRSTEFANPLSELFEDRSFFESLRLEPYYAYSAKQVPEAAFFLRSLIEETRSRREALVHGDYSPKNVLVHQDRLVLLDHEVIHWGDPTFDLGFSLAHFLSKAHHLRNRRFDFKDMANSYWQSYLDVLGDPHLFPNLESRAVRHALACLLARVAGRSPLEYLSEIERSRQCEMVVGLMRCIPATIAKLVQTFVDSLHDQ